MAVTVLTMPPSVMVETTEVADVTDVSAWIVARVVVAAGVFGEVLDVGVVCMGMNGQHTPLL